MLLFKAFVKIRTYSWLTIIFLAIFQVNSVFGLVEIGNKFLRVIGHPDSGRIIIKTVEGDPELKTDNNKFLLNEDYPPTSWTTISIDGINYKFGDRTGFFIVPLQEKNNILLSLWRIGDIDVTEVFEFVNNPTTDRDDAVKITYYAMNRGFRSKKLGIRIMLDTRLGRSDDAPFQIPEVGNILIETEFIGGKVPDYWYAFDRIDNPTIKAQGTLFQPGMNKPDRILFASWDRFEKYYWDFKLSKDRDFRRNSGEPDSAVALYWEPRQLEPGDRFEASTLFGIYGLSLYRGDVFNVSVGAPARTGSSPFVISVNIENVALYKVKNVKVRLKLPHGLLLFKNDKRIKSIGDIEGKGKRKTEFKVISEETLAGEVEFKVVVEGYFQRRKVSLTVERKIKIERFFAGASSIFSDYDAMWLDFSRINRLLLLLNGSIENTNYKLDEINSILKDMSLYTREKIEKDRKSIGNIMENVEGIIPLIQRDPRNVVKKR